MDVEDLKILIPIDTYFPEYILFKKKFKIWKEEIRESSVKESEMTPATGAIRKSIGNNLVEEIIFRRYPEIKHKIDKENVKNKRLKPFEIKQLLEYIVRHFTGNGMKMEVKDMERISRQIHVLFPNEDKV